MTYETSVAECLNLSPNRLIMSNLYLHIPFCQRKCHYCSFASYVSNPESQRTYLKALHLELESLSSDHSKEVSTLFLGGGTPTCLNSGAIVSLVKYCKQLFGMSSTCEVSVEANPGTVDEYYFEQLLQAGVNRLSLGVQSFLDSELLAIGRLHDKSTAIDACIAARNAGFSSINLDLMYGLPGQTLQSWSESLDQAFDLKVQHLSLYQLMVEEGTLFGQLEDRGELTLPEEEEILLIDSLTGKRCKEWQFNQYETSNFAQPGHECRHNINYWENNDYMAAGAAAVSYLGGVRQKRIEQPDKYTEAVLSGCSAIKETERLDRESSFRETVIMGLRMRRGVNLQRLESRYNLKPVDYYGDTLRKLLNNEMVELTPTHLKISNKGWPLSNRVMAELV